MAISESPPICPQCANGFITKGRCGACRYRVGFPLAPRATPADVSPDPAGANTSGPKALGAAVASHTLPVESSSEFGVKVQAIFAALLYLGSLLSLGAAVLFFAVAQSAVHEIQALICLLIAAVCFGSAAIVTVSSPRP